ncbi:MULTISPECIES: calcium-binding protein [unclassified Microcoleus]|uniref:calcium-binding protein n=1 Tax=unclassified Microcoleus TaxID=2642155 RepID=UPI002FD2A99E
MVLRADPSGVPRLIGDNTSESVFLSTANSQFGGINNFPSGVWMLGGNDTVYGAITSDLVFGNDGEDALVGNFGNDSLFGGKGKDDLWGGEGNDCLSGGQDTDWIIGGTGDDILLGGRGNDILYSGNGNDTLIGGLGRDWLSSVDNGDASPKTSGSNLYVLQVESGITDINKADFINNFQLGLDRIGLAGGLTVNDIVLDNLTNVLLLRDFDFSEYAKRTSYPADALIPSTFVISGTLIKVRDSGDLIGFVYGVTPSQLQNRIISVQGF